MGQVYVGVSLLMITNASVHTPYGGVFILILNKSKFVGQKLDLLILFIVKV